MPAGRSFVLYEDRPESLVGVKLACLSLREHVPEAQIRVHLGGQARSASGWFTSRVDAVQVFTDDLPSGVSGWNVKPELLLRALGDGSDQAVWIDSDVIVCGPLGARLDRAGEHLVATEDVWYGRSQRSGARTLAWGMEVGRLLPATVNTALLQVSGAHARLLEDWRLLLQDATYRHAQSLPYGVRPPHLVGDQDVLTAMLESTAWSHLPVDLLRRGVEMAQCYGSAGFSPGERLRVGAGRLPLAVHAMGPKPWRTSAAGASPSRVWHRAHMELTPYTALAARYAQQLPGDLDWTARATPLTRVLRSAAAGDPVLQEMPLAVVQWLPWRLRRDAGRLRRGAARIRGLARVCDAW